MGAVSATGQSLMQSKGEGGGQWQHFLSRRALFLARGWKREKSQGHVRLVQENRVARVKQEQQTDL